MKRAASKVVPWVESSRIASTSTYFPSTTSSARRSLSVAASPALPAEQHRYQSTASAWTEVLNRPMFSKGSTSSMKMKDGVRNERKLTPVARELVQELEMKSPNPSRAWQLFNHLEGLGQTGCLTIWHLRLLLRALQPLKKTVGSSNRAVLAVDQSTKLANAYSSQAELIRMRLQQRSADFDRGDYLTMIKAYRAFNYAPGIIRIWNESEQVRAALRPVDIKVVFDGLVGWIGMHEYDGGRPLARVAAEPLVSKAVEILAELANDPAKTEACLPSFFRICIRAGDSSTFFSTFRAVYGFDVAYPGAPITSSRAKLGHVQIRLVLEMLSETQDLSSMIAVFETFDDALPASIPATSSDSYSPSFFARSFSFGHNDSIVEQGTTEVQKPGEETPGLVGFHAYGIIIEAAARLGNGAIARHYFYQLVKRWSRDADARIEVLEKRVAAEGTDTTTLEMSGISSTSLASPPNSTMALPAPTIGISWKIIRTLHRQSVSTYDHVTMRFLRTRCLRILQLMKAQSTRMAAILESPRLAKLQDGNEIAWNLKNDLNKIEGQHESIAKLLGTIKHDSNLLATYQDVRRKETTLSNTMKKLHDLTHNSGDVPSSGSHRSKRIKALTVLRVKVRRKESQVLLARILLVKHRLARLYYLGKRRGQKEFDEWYGELEQLNRRRHGLGMSESKEPNGEVVENVTQGEVVSS